MNDILLLVALVLALGVAFAVALATWPIAAAVPAVIGGVAAYRLGRYLSAKW